MVGEIERVLHALNERNVRYLVVGGVAVVLHGHLRTTADLDLVVHLEPDNVRRAVKVLEDLGYRPRAPVAASEFADPARRASWIRDKGMRVFSFQAPSVTLEVDLFVEEPFDFEEAEARALRVQLERTHAPVVALDDLLDMKRAAGRPRDHEDVEALNALNGKEEDA